MRYRINLGVVIALQLVMAGATAIQPLYFQKLIVSLLDQTTSAFIHAVLILVGLFAIVAVSQMSAGYISATFSSNLLRDLQSQFFEKIARLPLGYLHDRSSGELFTRFNHDVGQSQSFITNIVPTFIKEGAVTILLAAVLIIFCPWELAVTTILIVAVGTSLSHSGHRSLEKYAIDQREGWGEINRYFDELVRGIETIKNFGAEKNRQAEFEHRIGKYRAVSVGAGKMLAVFSPAFELVSRFGTLLLVSAAYFLMADDELEIEVFFLFFFSVGLLQGSVFEMLRLYVEMPPHLVGMRNLAVFLDAEEEDLNAGEMRLEERGDIGKSLAISFQNIHFCYNEGRELYGGIDIDVPSNSITLITGANGSGKSTLIHLLLGFRTPSKGHIEIGGIPINQIWKPTFRSQISVVTQFHHVFHDTLRANLNLANPNATDAELIGALRDVGLQELLKRSSLGLDQTLDPAGRGMSGGEKQRLCIARLLLRKTAILVLDEPWSSLDRMSGQVLANILDKLRSNCTIIIISHDPDRFELDYDKQIELAERTDDPIREGLFRMD